MTGKRCSNLVYLSPARLIILLITFTTGIAQAQQSAEDVLGAIVGIQSTIPDDARTASALGTERTGSGVVIDDQGLVLTIGYLIMEASSVTIQTPSGEDVEAEILAYDHPTGFGLVRATRELGQPSLEIGSSADLETGDPVLIISSGGPQGVRAATVVDRREFAGYWEYLLDDAIFVSPPHPFFSGAALIGYDNRLVGIGSLVVSDAITGEQTVPGNMFVPIDLLEPILETMLVSGRGPAPQRPWLGIYTEELRGHVIVTDVASDSPASRAGVQEGDIVFKVGSTPVTTMAEFFRALWGLGDAGVTVPLTVLRSARIIDLVLTSADRYRWLRRVPGHVTTERSLDGADNIITGNVAGVEF